MVAVVVVLALAAFGCVKKPLAEDACVRPDLNGCPIEEIAIVGNHAIASSEIENVIATAETSHALLSFGLVVVEYELFDRFVLERDLARIERYYRAHGYFEAHARAARVVRLPGKKVRIEIAIDEGMPVFIERVDLAWKDWRLDEKTSRVTKSVTDVKGQLKIGTRFEEQTYDDVKRAMVRAMTDRGFAYGSAEGKVDVDLARHTATITMSLELGPPCVFGPITITGTGELPESSVRAAIDIDEGDPYSTSVLEAAEYALADYGVFGSINIEPQRSPPGQPPNPVIPVRFTTPPAALRSIKAGIGAELGSRLETHLVGGWENRNFLGGLRRLTVEARPGLELYPTSFNDLRLPTVAPLPEVRSRLEFKQPQVFEPRTNLILRGAVNVYHLQQEGTNNTSDSCYQERTTGEVRPSECTIVGYSEYVGTVGFERLFATSRFYLGEFAHWQIDDPFAYWNTGELASGFQPVTIRHLETIAWYDNRRGDGNKRDAVHPRSGYYLAANVQFAGSFLGGDTDDVRLRPELRAYLPISRKVTLGFRLAGGLLFPRNYGESLGSTGPVGAPSEADQAFTRDLQLLSFRAFFSGGAYSNRGYPTNSIGPRALIRDTDDVTKLKRVLAGGRTLWESSLELRFPLVGELGAGLFLDASDVTRGTGELRLTHPHLSAGFGLRYQTPVGPLRVDAGYRLPCLQITGTEPDGNGGTRCHTLPNDADEVLDDASERVRDEGDPGTQLGLPMSISIVFGEAF